NNIRFNEDPDVRILLRGLDYGPITRGIPLLTSHHAVILYVIGTEWHQTGAVPLGVKSVVFDPWPKQKPEIYDIQEFAGGHGFVRADEPVANPEQIFSGYPISNAVICTNYEGSQITKSSEPKTSVVIECPVNLLVTDSEGKRLGVVSDTNFVEEFSAHIYKAVQDGKTVGWYLGLTEKNYDIIISGESSGMFRMQISGESVSGQLLDYGEQPIIKNENAKIKLNAENPIPILILTDGSQIIPQIVPSGLEEQKTVTYQYMIMNNYPNPFNPTTSISYSIPNRSNVIIKVYDILGKEIETLITEEKPVGTYEVIWNASKYPSGVYFYKLQAGKFIETKKMILIK
ncbi:MAG: T9SS type A sorting domain-containing protein, partial [Melioribacteraceae bacterium]